MKKGFSLLTAIMFIVLVSTLGALALSFVTQTDKQTKDTYVQSQAEILLRSATEFGVLAMSAHQINVANGCLNTINIDYPNNTPTHTFDITINIRYFGNGLPAGCNTVNGGNGVVSPDIRRVALMDVFVQTNPNANLVAEPIRLHRRTLQKL